MIANKEKTVVEDITISEEELIELQEILNSASSHQNKAQAMKRIAGSGCCVCGVVPNKIVKYKMEDITRVERYCSQHFEVWVEEEKILVTATNGDTTIAVRNETKSLNSRGKMRQK